MSLDSDYIKYFVRYGIAMVLNIVMPYACPNALFLLHDLEIILRFYKVYEYLKLLFYS